MACYHPLPAWYAKSRTDKGKRGIVFNLSAAYKDMALQIPCGRCVGCRLEYARQWAVRCMHESKCHERNCFVTLTYDDSKLSFTKDGLATLNPSDFVHFMYRLRDSFGPGVRFFQCGEYGDNTFRPHHHALLFNCDFEDRRYLKGGQSGTEKLDTSDKLESLWKLGQCTVGDVAFQSANYIARYTLKKVHGDGIHVDEHYKGRVREYLTMSRKPGIGALWFNRYYRDFARSDSVVINGVEAGLPRFYNDKLDKLSSSDPNDVSLKRWRELKAARPYYAEMDPNNTGSRLIVREEVKEAAIALLARKVE